MSLKETPAAARPNEVLVSKECPSCGGKIHLSNATLNKKIRCPKCRRTVVISVGSLVPPTAVAIEKSPRIKKDALPEETALPVFIDQPRKQLPPAEKENPKKEMRWAAYCLCGGVFKKHEAASSSELDAKLCATCPSRDSARYNKTAR